ncbi:MAG: DNA repair protein RecO [Bacteroidota bacterium]|nr:DNA repair protein RecO [Bacteroidota bacterium]
MLYKTRGIVINYIRYKESSIIVKIFTEQFGIQSYIVNGVRSKKGSKIALYQPLTLLELVVYHKYNANLFRISEIKCPEPFNNIPKDIKRSCIAMFLTEVLSKALKGETEPKLFDFIYQTILFLEHIEVNFENIHLQFLLKLSRYLGFEPESEVEILDQIGQVPVENEQINEPALLKALLVSDYTNDIKINNRSRRKLLDILLKYYSLHIESFGEMKSVVVLKEVME